MLVVLPAIPLLATGFLNDDIQILRPVLEPMNGNFFEIFTSPHVWKYYWRPIHVLLIKLIGLIDGFNPFYFRITGLVLYLSVLFLLMKILRVSGINEDKALTITLLFSLLPSHELNIAWIADQSELLTAIFLLSALYIYIRYLPQPECKQKNLYYLFITLAFLSKEIAITSFFLPFAALMLVGNISLKSLKTAVFDSIKTATIIATILLYRILVVGAVPFSSGHLSELSVINLMKNLFLYIPFSFISPEIAEFFAEYLGVFGFILTGTLISLGLIMYFIKQRKENLQKIKIMGGLFWFIIFVIPVSPVFMRWYAFIPSLGLIIAIAFVINDIQFGKIFKASFAILLIVLSLHNLQIWLNWFNAGQRMITIAESIRNLNLSSSEEPILVWGLPDKINRVPVMKLGVNETFSFYSKTEQIVESPLRSEIFSDKVFTTKVQMNDSGMTLQMPFGRYLPQNGKSSSILKNETVEFKWNNFLIKITNDKEGATARIFGELKTGQMYYYNGEGVFPLNSQKIIRNKAK